MNSNSVLTQGAAFDIRNLDALKRTAKEDPQQGLKAAAKQMEGLFVQMMLKSMRDASFKDGLFNSQQSEMFTSMYDQQIAQNMADRGSLGLADMMVKQMGGEVENTHATTRTAQVPLSLDTASFKRIPQRLNADDIVNQQTAREAGLGGSSRDFISRMLAPAMDASQKSGVPHQLIIAQAALESGWGEQEILTKEGKPSHNLFGIKATGNWKGKTTEITTTEYINGIKQKVKASFRVYESYSDALSDYASLLTNNPRYGNVANASSAESGARELQRGGYATDPQYANKLISVIKQIKLNVNNALSAYKGDISSLF
ncbi:MAG: flagellar assembly peptidoglycan hydrolase FlgJ [Enterobacterales bacterium]|uniref:flagellar assembly peptidoglycan hydrolase FlgJ n=1 Tax=Obesumbacterium proteus TaxID=82983 RepID=UPI000622B37D|nr:flagellar assembly peptidoglycan hydrolase FlgJ [Obesumbacterium proteus]MDN6109653.1 flagellar assembly peptidoglycan hydrolase FlgJ [Enterobacterales bacterium]KKI43522.1 flagellar rod assembly protein FlgJ [Obesumbacterium proteus]MCE9883573.1 flagellar assembly peptidoglycan hydrolase FlgJ [Obesumbacterium proteus]MCE9915174.1 flagellar assembly peptidoglycan hydrolase FlgJ [Obesumbacterium proteus]MCE9927944.1 flagellar assembly peptidoglycan hydrolase FlgJ [Obesumbacterium proteus]